MLPLARQLRTLTGHDDLVQAIAVNGDQSRLATAGWDRTTRVWNPFADELPLTLLGHTNKVTDLVFSPDGKALISASEDDTVRWYALDIRELIALARTRVSRVLTKDECRRYLHGADCPKGQSAIEAAPTEAAALEPSITPAGNATPALAKTHGQPANCCAYVVVALHADARQGVCSRRQGHELRRAYLDLGVVRRRPDG